LPGEPIETSSYRVDRLGPWPAEAITLRFDGTPFAPPADRAELIERTWLTEQAAAARLGRRLFNGKLARVRDVAGAPAEPPTITLEPTDYRAFLVTNLLAPEHFAPEQRANALGLSALLWTRDGGLMLGRRSRHVAYNRQMVHPFGGVAEWSRIPSARDGDGRWIVEQLEKELFEEVALDPEDIEEFSALALVRDLRQFQPELIFLARLRLGASALTRNWERQAGANDEHTALWRCDATAQAIAAELTADSAQFTPVATAALIALAAIHFGPAAVDALLGPSRPAC